MLCIVCEEKDDIALNAMSAGWMNEFVEVVLGSAIIIPISIGYLGIDKVIELTQAGALGLGFRTMPFLFQNWGVILGAIAGVAFFGLLFFAGITSSLAMGTPYLSFLRDEYNYTRKKAAWFFGGSVLILGLPTVLFFKQGVLDEYDYWAGSVALVLFALIETILFSWVFGLKKGWKELITGSDIKIPGIYKFIIKWVTPFMLLIVFVGSLIRPANDEWNKISLSGWTLHKESILGQILKKGREPNKSYFARELYAEFDGVVDSLYHMGRRSYISISGEKEQHAVIPYNDKDKVVVEPGSNVKTGDVIYIGNVINKWFYIDLSRMLLLAVFLVNMGFIYVAYKRRKRNGTI